MSSASENRFSLMVVVQLPVGFIVNTVIIGVIVGVVGVIWQPGMVTHRRPAHNNEVKMLPQVNPIIHQPTTSLIVGHSNLNPLVVTLRVIGV